ncbi:MAG: glutamate racemase [Syntrophales bacterium]|mgnify:CR=1 FL=1|jgi:glutamate racemase|nr:glutamate racemase [Syntrophales bacterium]HOG08308.1 glutamate racemase [Syntrophales bacterium]HPB70883.1 glutamate racemase [Syntrophales bacterium]HQN26745.1 glutamate racemase [Syntrophales bacterium]HQP29094.1 glutamate racemase [Syntrophales bacterium]
MQKKETPGGNARHPIGVFDSGVGGLTVVRALMERLPFENLIYFGDTARVPYGVKSAETINLYAAQITEFLLQREVKLLIIACNTMAAVAHEAVVSRSPVPVLDVIDAGARMTIRTTRTKHVGVIGTPATVNSNTYARAIHRLDPEVRIFSQACALFVPLVEEGWFDHPVTRLTAQEYLKPILAEGIDTLVLGCTHYPLLKALLREVTGPAILLVDSAEAMADITADLLTARELANPDREPPDYRFYVTDVPLHFQGIGERILGRSLPHVERVSL